MRILHTMLRVRSLDVSIRFYNEVLGMKLLSRTDFDAGRYTLAFLGYQDGDSSSTIELTHNWDRSDYVLGDGYGHIAIGADDIVAVCKRAREKGANVTREPGPMKGADVSIAFLEDPDGYNIELIESR